MLTVFCDIKEIITIDFLENGGTVNNVSYCQLLKQYFTLFIEQPSYNAKFIIKSMKYITSKFLISFYNEKRKKSSVYHMTS